MANNLPDRDSAGSSTGVQPEIAANQREPFTVLAINGGSSSVRFAIYQREAGELRRGLHGKLDRIGTSEMNLRFVDSAGNAEVSRIDGPNDHRSAAGFFLDWLESKQILDSVSAVGHRIVHGMHHTEPEGVTSDLLDELNRITQYDSEHLSLEIGLIEAIRQRCPKLAQVACFDTAFHRSMPPVARLLPIPRRYARAGVERYGFHGLSYMSLMGQLGAIDPAAAQGRVVLAHLGNGASVAAVHAGKSIDTSMGFTPTAGLMMGSRSGDLDPGLVSYFNRTEQMSADKFHQMVNYESGLLGVSEISSDMRDLLAHEPNDARAAEAIALFCYQTKKWIGAFAAALGGLDTLVFAGGIGEQAPVIRERICAGLEFLGVRLEAEANTANAGLISPPDGHVAVRVLRTDEELTIARLAAQVIAMK